MSGNYPSVYEAKAVILREPVLVAYVPAVFGDVAIEITDFLSKPVPGPGWVLFQAGNCEFPVWVGNNLMATGEFVQSNEVWIGPDTPTSEVELWYDTDDDALKAKVSDTWVEVGGNEVFVGPNPPVDPNVLLWYDTDAVPSTTTPTWTSITLQNGWAPYPDTNWQPPQYLKESHHVYVRGTLLAPPSGGMSVTAWTMPPGYTPPKNIAFAPTATNRASDPVEPEIQFHADGTVSLMHIADGSHVHLGNIQYSVAP